MYLGERISREFFSISLDTASSELDAHVKALLIDAFANIVEGASTEIADLALTFGLRSGDAGGRATILPSGLRTDAGGAALVNGAMLRSLDLMDVFVARDVCHPSESIPAALACAEASGASGKLFLDTILAALCLHAQLARTVALHRNGLHHVGHAAWVVPLIAARLRGLGPEVAASALNLSASGLIVPEGFCRGHVANVKAMAFPMLARRAIEMADLAQAGLATQPAACEEVIALLGRIFGEKIEANMLVPTVDAGVISQITLKAYPAQYALQPLIAAAIRFARAHPDRIAAIRRVKVKVGAQTVARTADTAKYRPASREAADHSLPFCVAAGLVDGAVTVESLYGNRWKAPEILSMIDRISVEGTDGSADAFTIGQQEMTLVFADDTSVLLDCTFPDHNQTWRQIADAKLAASTSPRVAAQITEAVENLESSRGVGSLIAALCLACGESNQTKLH